MRTQKKPNHKSKPKSKKQLGGNEKMITLETLRTQLFNLYEQPIQTDYIERLTNVAANYANLDSMISLVYELCAFAKQYAAENIKNVMDAVLLSDDMIVQDATPLFEKYQTIFNITTNQEDIGEYQFFLQDLVYLIRIMISVYAYQSTDNHPKFKVDFANTNRFNYEQHLQDQTQPPKIVIPYDPLTCKQLRIHKEPKIKAGEECIVVFPSIYSTESLPLIKYMVISVDAELIAEPMGELMTAPMADYPGTGPVPMTDSIWRGRV